LLEEQIERIARIVVFVVNNVGINSRSGVSLAKNLLNDRADESSKSLRSFVREKLQDA
jgi:hypothetical protein